MEYVGMIISYLATSVVTTRLIFKNTEIINLGSTIVQSGIIGVGIVFFTLMFNMIRAYRSCENEKYGLTSGLSLSLFACIFGISMFVLLNLTGIIFNIITTILPILTDYVEVGRGILVALSAFMGYWFGRIFIKLC
jgi:hypothetical protein